MFVIQLNYKRPLSDVDRFVDEHREFLERHYISGHFLLSGRKEPRTGGVILAKAETKAEIESIVRSDPFYRENIAEYEIVEFLPSMAASHLADLDVPNASWMWHLTEYHNSKVECLLPRKSIGRNGSTAPVGNDAVRLRIQPVDATD